jgi:hypothetical protein
LSLLLGGDLIDDLALFGAVFGTVEAVIEGSEFDVRFDPQAAFRSGNGRYCRYRDPLA